MSNQLPPSMRKVNASQLGRFTRLSLSISVPDTSSTSRLYTPARVGARVVHLPGLRLRCGAPGGEVAVSQRAQRLTELLVAADRIRRRRKSHASPDTCCLYASQLRPALHELAHLIGTLEGELGSRLAVAVLVVPTTIPMPSNSDRIEGVFVGEVVADVDRQHATRRVDAVADPGQRGALVPVDVGPQLDEHCARRSPADPSRCPM